MNTPPADPLDAVAEDVLARLRAGDRPEADEYAARHPELAGRIRELFPSLLALRDCVAPPPLVKSVQVVRSPAPPRPDRTRLVVAGLTVALVAATGTAVALAVSNARLRAALRDQPVAAKPAPTARPQPGGDGWRPVAPRTRPRTPLE